MQIHALGGVFEAKLMFVFDLLGYLLSLFGQLLKILKKCLENEPDLS